MLADAADAADAKVPTCPDWRTDDLIWHLTEVQGFWSRIVDQDLRTEEAVAALSQSTRPEGRAALVEGFDRGSTALIQTLSTAQPDEVRGRGIGLAASALLVQRGATVVVGALDRTEGLMPAHPVSS